MYIRSAWWRPPVYCCLSLSLGLEDVDGVTALMRACGNGHLKTVEELLVHGAGMWCAGPTDDPKTSFMWAAHYGQLDIVRWVHQY